MKIQNKVIHGIILMAGAAGVMTLAALLFGFSSSIQNGILLGIFLSTFNAVISFLSLYWSIQKSSSLFFATWSGGIFARLLIFSGTAWFIFRNPSFDFLSTLLTLVFSTFLMMFLEFDFLPKRTA